MLKREREGRRYPIYIRISKYLNIWQCKDEMYALCLRDGDNTQ